MDGYESRSLGWEPALGCCRQCPQPHVISVRSLELLLPHCKNEPSGLSQLRVTLRACVFHVHKCTWDPCAQIRDQNLPSPTDICSSPFVFLLYIDRDTYTADTYRHRQAQAHTDTDRQTQTGIDRDRQMQTEMDRHGQTQITLTHTYP